MHYRKLGKSGLEISDIGYGAWGMGADWWKGSTDQESLDALSMAVDLGVTFFDTAMGYGDGHSERLIGQALHGCSKPVHVGTKIRPMNYNFGPKAGNFSQRPTARSG